MNAFGTILCFTSILIVVTAITVNQSNSINDGERQARGWNIMHEGAKRSCVGMNGRSGVCMGQSECTEMNGKSVGRCFPFDSCCSVTPNSCGGYSGFSTSYFQSPDKFQEVCAYKINVRRNVCQIRIDFERFSLGQPTKPSEEIGYACERDEFTLISNDNTKINLPVLCGENSGQHVYVPINEQTSSDLNNRRQITMKFRLTPRDENYNDPEPSWKLKISQLECQTTSTNWWKIKEIARQVWDWEEEERDVSKIKYSLAPEGCLQYFTDKEGSFESFNYNKGTGHYLGNLNYAVCFKRNQGTCGIRYESVKFQVAYNRKLTSFTDRDCDMMTSVSGQTTTSVPTTLQPSSTSEQQTTLQPSTTSEEQTTLQASTTTEPQTTLQSSTTTEPQTTLQPTNSPVQRSGARDTRRQRWTANLSDARGDYLLIPDGLYTAGKLFASKYCGRSLENFKNVIVKTQGPIYVAFVSDDYTNPNENVEIGYKINYSLINTGC